MLHDMDQALWAGVYMYSGVRSESYLVTAGLDHMHGFCLFVFLTFGCTLQHVGS